MVSTKNMALTLALALAVASPAAADGLGDALSAGAKIGGRAAKEAGKGAHEQMKRSVPLGSALGVLAAPVCFEVVRGPIGAIDGSGIMRGLCTVMIPTALVTYALLPLFPFELPDVAEGATVHHVDITAYLLDFNTKSALTGSVARAPVGGLFGSMGYDLGYTYKDPTNGLIGYAHGTWQQTSLASSNYLIVSNSFVKLDAQVGFDLMRYLSGGSEDSAWARHTATVRVGPSLFHDWIYSRDVGNQKEAANIDNPLNNVVPLVTGLGYEVAAEAEVRFPKLGEYSLGGLRFVYERGSYPSINFPELNPRDGAFVAMIGFDELRKGSSYLWQRTKLELELPFDFSRAGAVFLGGQLASFENSEGSGVENRGFSIDYRFAFK